jgi:hypothetical protein
MSCRLTGPLRLDRDRLGKPLASLLAVLGLMVPSIAAHADSGEAVALPQFNRPEFTLIWIVLASGVVSVLMGIYWYRSVAAKSAGTAKMEEVGKAIRDGANA